MNPKPRAQDIWAMMASLGLLLWFLLHRTTSPTTESVLLPVAFGVAAWLLQGVDWTGAVTGVLLTFLCYAAGGIRLFAVLLLVFVLTLLATRAGGASKRLLGLAHDLRGRSASQVASNLFVATSCFALSAHLKQQGFEFEVYFTGMAALGEAAADTVSSEIGVAFGGKPISIVNFKRVLPGANGGITIVGTAAGISAAMIVSALAAYLYELPVVVAILWMVAGTIGMFADSLLGGTLEARGKVSNNVVNLCGTATAVVAFFLIVMAPR